MNVVTRPADASDALFAYTVKRAALGEYVAQVWGWDEAVQRAYHASDWAVHHPDIVELNGVPIGTLEVAEHHDYVSVRPLHIRAPDARRALR
jgi:hypothetical protein